MKNTPTLNLAAVKAYWLDHSASVDTTYMRAACKFADMCNGKHLVHGVPDMVYKTEFECAVDTRNRMLGAVATSLLSNVDDSVSSTESYDQYRDGLITAIECCNYLVTH